MANLLDKFASILHIVLGICVSQLTTFFSYIGSRLGTRTRIHFSNELSRVALISVSRLLGVQLVPAIISNHVIIISICLIIQRFFTIWPFTVLIYLSMSRSLKSLNLLISKAKIGLSSAQTAAQKTTKHHDFPQ